MDRIFFGKLIVLLFLLLKFILIPLCSSLTVIIKLFTLKKTLKRAGTNYHKEPNNPTPSIIIYINIALIILLIFMAISGQTFIPILCFSFILYSAGDIIINKIYGNVCGIYKNGIIDYNKSLKKWNEIHSYKIADTTISGYFNDGNLYEYKNVEGIDEIEDIFKKNNIKKRDE
jgi:hypothetical protein